MVYGDQQLTKECYRIALRRVDGEETSAEPQREQKNMLLIQDRDVEAKIWAYEDMTLDAQIELLRLGKDENQ